MPPRIVFSLLCWTSSLCWMDSQRNLPAGDSRQRLCLRHSLQCRVLQSPDKRHAESAMLILSPCHDANKHSLKFSVVSFLYISTSSLICRVGCLWFILCCLQCLLLALVATTAFCTCFAVLTILSCRTGLDINWFQGLSSEPTGQHYSCTCQVVSARSCAELQGL